MSNALLDTAYANRFLRDESEVRMFEDALAEYFPSLSSEDLPALYGIFEEDTEHHEVMFGLVHLIEKLPPTSWVAAYVRELPRMMPRAAEWADTIMARSLNGTETNPLLAEELRSATPDALRCATDLLTDIAGTSPQPVGLRAERMLADIQRTASA